MGVLLEALGGHLGLQNRSEKGSQNELDFRTVFMRLLGATTGCGAGSPGLQPDPRGGVGEGSNITIKEGCMDGLAP